MCPFCSRGQDAWGELLGQNELAYLITLPEPVLPNSVMVIPKRHVVTPFELTEAESRLLFQVMQLTVLPRGHAGMFLECSAQVFS